MKLKTALLYLCLFMFIYFGCSRESEVEIPEEGIEIIENTEKNEEEIEVSEDNIVKILALGDSYTIGQSVCETCRFPEQLKDSLKSKKGPSIEFELKVIARTGWATYNLINAITTENPSNDYDLVTLLIGVNNEFQRRPFSVYETEFPQLVNTAIAKGKGNKNNVIVVSIPDYAFTPFGNGNQNISTRLDTYNNFAKNYCSQNGITYVYITDITRQGLANPALVASDGLHPSELADSKFVEKILPLALEKL